MGGALEDLVDGIRTGRVAPGRRGRAMVLEARTFRLTAAAFATSAAELPARLDAFAARHRSSRGTDHRVALAAFPGASRRAGDE